MFCDKCGSALPSNGFVCTHCGSLMSKSQIEMQKKFNDENKKFASPSYMSSKYGSNREFRLNDKKDNSNVKAVFILMGIILLFLILILAFL